MGSLDIASPKKTLRERFNASALSAWLHRQSDDDVLVKFINEHNCHDIITGSPHDLSDFASPEFLRIEKIWDTQYPKRHFRSVVICMRHTTSNTALRAIELSEDEIMTSLDELWEDRDRRTKLYRALEYEAQRHFSLDTQHRTIQLYGELQPLKMSQGQFDYFMRVLVDQYKDSIKKIQAENQNKAVDYTLLASSLLNSVGITGSALFFGGAFMAGGAAIGLGIGTVNFARSKYRKYQAQKKLEQDMYSEDSTSIYAFRAAMAGAVLSSQKSALEAEKSFIQPLEQTAQSELASGIGLLSGGWAAMKTNIEGQFSEGAEYAGTGIGFVSKAIGGGKLGRLAYNYLTKHGRDSRKMLQRISASIESILCASDINDIISQGQKTDDIIADIYWYKTYYFDNQAIQAKAERILSWFPGNNDMSEIISHASRARASAQKWFVGGGVVGLALGSFAKFGHLEVLGASRSLRIDDHQSLHASTDQSIVLQETSSVEASSNNHVEFIPEIIVDIDHPLLAQSTLTLQDLNTVISDLLAQKKPQSEVIAILLQAKNPQNLIVHLPSGDAINISWTKILSSLQTNNWILDGEVQFFELERSNLLIPYFISAEKIYRTLDTNQLIVSSDIHPSEYIQNIYWERYSSSRLEDLPEVAYRKPHFIFPSAIGDIHELRGHVMRYCTNIFAMPDLSQNSHSSDVLVWKYRIAEMTAMLMNVGTAQTDKLSIDENQFQNIVETVAKKPITLFSQDIEQTNIVRDPMPAGVPLSQTAIHTKLQPLPVPPIAAIAAPEPTITNPYHQAPENIPMAPAYVAPLQEASHNEVEAEIQTTAPLSLESFLLTQAQQDIGPALREKTIMLWEFHYIRAAFPENTYEILRSLPTHPEYVELKEGSGDMYQLSWDAFLTLHEQEAKNHQQGLSSDIFREHAEHIAPQPSLQDTPISSRSVLPQEEERAQPLDQLEPKTPSIQDLPEILDMPDQTSQQADLVGEESFTEQSKKRIDALLEEMMKNIQAATNNPSHQKQVQAWVDSKRAEIDSTVADIAKIPPKPFVDDAEEYVPTPETSFLQNIADSIPAPLQAFAPMIVATCGVILTGYYYLPKKTKQLKRLIHNADHIPSIQAHQTRIKLTGYMRSLNETEYRLIQSTLLHASWTQLKHEFAQAETIDSRLQVYEKIIYFVEKSGWEKLGTEFFDPNIVWKKEVLQQFAHWITSRPNDSLANLEFITEDQMKVWLALESRFIKKTGCIPTNTSQYVQSKLIQNGCPQTQTTDKFQELSHEAKKEQQSLLENFQILQPLTEEEGSLMQEFLPQLLPYQPKKGSLTEDTIKKILHQIIITKRIPQHFYLRFGKGAGEVLQEFLARVHRLQIPELMMKQINEYTNRIVYDRIQGEINFGESQEERHSRYYPEVHQALIHFVQHGFYAKMHKKYFLFSARSIFDFQDFVKRNRNTTTQSSILIS